MMYAELFYTNRLIVLENYENKCANGCESEESVDVHHKDEDRDNNEISNLIPLCRKCHIKAHGGTPLKDSYSNRSKPSIIKSDRQTLTIPIKIKQQVIEYKDINGYPTFTAALLNLVRLGLKSTVKDDVK